MGFQLRGKVVLITGASSGIGAAAARAYSGAGAKVVLAARQLARAESLAQELIRLGREAMAVPCDVRDEGQVSEAVSASALRFGGLDVLVSNAGVGLYGRVEALTAQMLHEVFETNVYGPLRLVSAGLPRHRERGGGQILMVSAVLGYRALPGMGGYCATKAALNSLTEALRVELRGEAIDVILVAPGSTATEFRRRAASVSGARGRENPLGTMSAEEVARAMVRASRRRSREVVLTAAGKALIGLQRASPALCDRVAARALER